MPVIHPCPVQPIPDLFLAGSISGAPDWQSTACAALPDLTIANPRSPTWDADAPPSAVWRQIRWERMNLKQARWISFRFAAGTDSPITFAELGEFASSGRVIAVGVELGFSRYLNVQAICEDHNIPLFWDLDNLINHIRSHS